MIELRWVERHEMAHHLGDNIMQKVKVLQYRRMREGYLMLDTNDNPIAKEWSDWIDVPTVTEG